MDNKRYLKRLRRTLKTFGIKGTKQKGLKRKIVALSQDLATYQNESDNKMHNLLLAGISGSLDKYSVKYYHNSEE